MKFPNLLPPLVGAGGAMVSTRLMSAAYDRTPEFPGKPHAEYAIPLIAGAYLSNKKGIVGNAMRGVAFSGALGLVTILLNQFRGGGS